MMSCEIKTPPYSAKSMKLEDQTEIAYLYQHISNHQESKAVEWINKYHATHLRDRNECRSVLFAAIKTNMNEVILTLQINNLATSSEVAELEQQWNKFSKTNA
jgi:hypothetical protein